MRNYSPRNRQSGVVLVVALLLLLILSMIGVTLARMQTVEERMARNETDGQFARQAAEAALRSAETLLGFAPAIGTFAGNTQGYYVISPTTGSRVPTLIWNLPANVRAYSSPALSSLPLAAQTPRIVMEYVGAGAIPGDDITIPPPTYRVTVQGLNADGNPSVMLQSIYR